MPTLDQLTDRDIARVLVNRLNDLIKDEYAKNFVDCLIKTRIVVGEQIRKHPTIQCSFNEEDCTSSAGFLGLLNGIVGIDDRDGFGHILSVRDAQGYLVNFKLKE